MAALLLLLPVPAQAGGPGGGGAEDSCTQAALESRLAAGGLLTFNCGPLPITIVLTREETIRLNTVIDGGGRITLSARDTAGICFVNGVRLTLRNLTLAHGTSKVGGAVQNAGQLTVLNTNFIDNTALAVGGAIYSLTRMTITGGLFFSNAAAFGVGGAIDNDGRLVLRASTVESNSAPTAVGGGLLNHGQLLAEQDYFLDNTAIGDSGFRSGGGLAQGLAGSAWVMNSAFVNNQARIGGGLVTSGTLSLSNITFSGNEAFSGGGLSVPSGTLTVTNSTFKDNTGVFLFGPSAIDSRGGSVVVLKNTIVAGDPTDNCLGSVTSLGHNLDDGHTCGLNASGDLTDTDPVLGPLLDNGGLTPTHALLPGSPALNHGDDAGCPATDQRGFPRLDHCDIGAFEEAYRLLLPLAKR